jgi:2-methylcitrate dehydratase PrpD
METQSLGDRLAPWACALELQQVPADVLADARLRVLDTLAAAVSAKTAGPAVAAHAAALQLGSGGGARILAWGDAAAPAWAAMVNGTMAHANDYDDTHPGASIHVSAPVVSAAISLAEAVGAEGRDFVAAVIAGSELTARIGAAATGKFQARGLHPTGIVGTIGAAIAAGRLLKLSPLEMRHAIGIAASQASGISESFGDGTWPRRLHPGWAAHSGIVAAYLARSGFTGPRQALEGRFGLFAAFLGSRDHPFEQVAVGLGETWLAPQSAFKPYPCGHVIQGFVDAALALVRQHAMRPDEIIDVTCLVSPWMLPLVAEPREQKIRPASESAAKGSLYYTVAATLTFGRLDAEAYEPEPLHDPGILALAAKIACVPDPNPPAKRRYKGHVVVRTIDGRVLEAIVENSLGSAANPMSPADLQAKARRIAGGVVGDDAVDGLIELCGRVETLPDLTGLIDVCCGAATR